MPDPLHDAVEEVKELEHEAEEGKTARTPFLLVGGVGIFVLTVVALVMILAFAGYYLTK